MYIRNNGSLSDYDGLEAAWGFGQEAGVSEDAQILMKQEAIQEQIKEAESLPPTPAEVDLTVKAASTEAEKIEPAKPVGASMPVSIKKEESSMLPLFLGAGLLLFFGWSWLGLKSYDSEMAKQRPRRRRK